LIARSAPRPFAGPARIAAGELHLFGNPMHGLHKGDLDVIAQIITGNRTVSSGTGSVTAAKAKEVTEDVTKT